MVIAGLERHVERCTARFARGRERFGFGVRVAALAMEALAERDAVAHQRRADGRVGRGAAFPARGELASAREIHASTASITA